MVKNDPQELLMPTHDLFRLPSCPLASLLSAICLFECHVFSSLLSMYFFHFTIVLLFLQVIVADLSNVSSMIECGLLSEALDSIRNAVFPGVLPPATYLISLIEYAQQVGLEIPDCTNSHLWLCETKGLYK